MTRRTTESPAAKARRAAGIATYWAKPESRAAASERANAHWSDEAARSRQSEITRRRMAAPGVKQRIAERTALALSNPETKAKQRAGLAAVWTPEKRAAHAELTRIRMREWRTRKLAEAEKVLAQLPADEREAFLNRVRAGR